MKNTFERINQTVWELHQKVKEDPGNFEYRRDLLRFFHESRLVMERRSGLSKDDSSFLLMQERESLCCFLLHGAGGSPREMRSLGEYLYKMGFTVFCLSLPMAQRRNDDYLLGAFRGKFRRRDNRRRNERFKRGMSWSASLTESGIALNTVLEYAANTYVIGFSFGGTIALNLLRSHPVKGAILIAPALVPVTSSKYVLFKVLRKMLPSMASQIAPREDTIVEFMERTRGGDEEIEKPLLVVQAAYDPVVSNKGFDFLKARATHPKSRFHLLYSRRHIIVEGEDSEKVSTLCGDFIKEI